MATTSSIESVIKSEQFQCRRVPNKSNIPTVIVTNELSNSASNIENTDSNGLPPSNLLSAPTKPDTSKDASTNKPKFGKVVISLENPILPEETINNTPSMANGLDCETEQDLRITGCKLIQISGVLLRLPQVAMATGQILLQRYYYSKSFVRFPMEITAMACVVLASKVEEAPRRIRDIINVFHNMKQIRLKQSPVPMVLNEAYVNTKNQIIKAERRILKELGFCVHVKHPHKFIITLTNILDNSSNTELIQAAWSYMNDSLHTNVFVRFPPETVACACIHLSARILRVPLPTSPPWYSVFGVNTETITKVCQTILQLYARKPLQQEELEEKVELARKALDDAKLKAKAHLNAQGTETPNATSLDSIIDSRTNSPIKYGSDVIGGSSKSLEVLSAINRLKQQQQQQQQQQQSGSTKTSPSSLSPRSKIKSTINVANSNPGSALNSTSSTPIKLEKSPTTLMVPPAKRSRSPSPRDHRRSSRERNDSYSSGDDHSRKSQEHHYSRGGRYKNGHSTTHQRNDHYDNDNRESLHRESDSYRHRSRSPPRSYVSSAVSIGNDYNSSSSSSKYQRLNSGSRSPSNGHDRYGHYNSRHTSSKSSSNSYRDRSDNARYDDRHSSSGSRHEHHHRSRKEYDSRDRRGDNYRDRYDDSGYGRNESRSPGGYRHRDDYSKSSSSSRNRSKY